MSADRMSAFGLVGELTDLQRKHNAWLMQATPEERVKAARDQLRYIASVEPDSYGYLFDEDDE